MSHPAVRTNHALTEVNNAVQSQQVLEWQAEAVLAKQVETLIKVLEVRFTSIPAEVADSIRATTDCDKLDAWLPPAIQCASLDEFRQSAGI